MSTKNTTTGSNSTAFNFDPAALNAYHGAISTLMPWLRSNITNPFGSDAFRQESSVNQDNALNVGQRMKSNVLNNAAAMGYNTSGGMFNSLLAQAGRASSGLQAQGFRSAVGNAIGRQMQSAGMLNAFQPLMTGSQGNYTNTQTTSGLGTWLPQVIGAGVGAAANAFMPGAGSMMGASSKGVPGTDPGYNWSGGIIGGLPGGGSTVGPMGMFPSVAPQGPYGYGSH